MQKIKIEIGNKDYTVQVAETDRDRYIGLSETKNLPKDEGMLFIIPEQEQGNVMFTMEDTEIPLDIIFIDNDGEVISVHPTKAFEPNMVTEKNAAFVLELNINSGVSESDQLEEIDDSDYTDEEKKTLSKSKMLILDENGDVQGKIDDGCRIFSRIFTRKMLKQALKAYKSDSDQDYIKLGRIVFKELNAQDSREPEYVDAPN